MAGTNEHPVHIECVLCKRETKHDVVARHSMKDQDEESGVEFGQENLIVKCRGCDSVTFVRETWNDQNVDVDTGAPNTNTTLYPNRTSGRAVIDAVRVLPAKVRHVYRETIDTFNAGALLLAAVGLRAVVEAVCLDQKCSGRDLKRKIDELVTKGAIAKDQAEFLHLHRMLGNEAVHEIAAPTSEELVAAIDIVESVLKTLYQLPEIAADLKAARDKRKARKP
jgi:hypothetical protein